MSEAYNFGAKTKTDNGIILFCQDNLNLIEPSFTESFRVAINQFKMTHLKEPSYAVIGRKQAAQLEEIRKDWEFKSIAYHSIFFCKFMGVWLDIDGNLESGITMYDARS